MTRLSERIQSAIASRQAEVEAIDKVLAEIRSCPFYGRQISCCYRRSVYAPVNFVLAALIMIFPAA